MINLDPEQLDYLITVTEPASDGPTWRDPDMQDRTVCQLILARADIAPWDRVTVRQIGLYSTVFRVALGNYVVRVRLGILDLITDELVSRGFRRVDDYIDCSEWRKE